ncbi:MAG: PQQ-binding-like beta-propeller repeat protein, partial [Opitutaceae bacterium]
SLVSPTRKKPPMTTFTRPTSRVLPVTCCALALAGAASLASAANWPGWRGPQGDGTTTTAKDLPVTWSTEENVKWKRELPAWSGASPVIWGDKIFIMSPSKEETAAQTDSANLVGSAAARAKSGRGGGNGRSPTTSGPGGQEIMLLCLSRADGTELWRKQFDRGNEIRMRHNSSSPSPVTDGKLVWVMSGNGMLACFDFAGNQKWKFDVPGKFGKLGLNHGYGSSPLLLDGKLIIPVLHGMKTDDPSYLVSLNATSGDVLWRVERPTNAQRESPDSYITPALLDIDGKKQIVVVGGDCATGHDADTLREIWRVDGLNPRNNGSYRIVASPVVRDGIIFTPTRERPLTAIKPGGTGDVTTSHVLWRFDGPAAPDVPTPVSDGERLYIAGDRGQFVCLDAKTGATIYGPHDTGIGETSGSPILADGKLYITSQTAETAVIQAGPEYKLLAKNSLDNSWTLSSPAIADGEIFIRTATHLYCLAKK